MMRETIERLAIDSAAGELNEDAEVLFQTYLAGNPQARQWADKVRQIFDGTEAAIRAKTALPENRKVALPMTPVLRVNWMTVIRWAAVILLGTFVGFTAGRWEAPAKTQRMVVQEPAPDPKSVETLTDLKEQYAGTFWGDKMLAFVDNTNRHQHRANLGNIRPWNTYRQLIKGNKNE